MKYIYTFSKNKQVQYVSHLDTLRVFERAMRRAKIPMAYSQGYHPHPLITFAQPLGVGIAGCGELVEIAFDRPLSEEEQERFRMAMPGGFELLRYRENDMKSPFAALALAEYEILTETKIAAQQAEDLMNRKEILMLKRSKKGEKQVNIRSMIRNLEITETEGGTVLRALLKAGEPSLKPELLLRAMEQELNLDGIVVRSICRNALLDDNAQPLC